jgi:hypothetical protein
MIGDTIEELAHAMRARAIGAGWINYGTAGPDELIPFTDFVAIGELTVTVIFTRDAGHHTGGWLKNPDYERCYHLSLSFRGSDGHPLNPARRLERAPQMHRLARQICVAFYGPDTRYLWAEPPFSEEGKRLQVWHYRVFCDPAWRPIVPRREVYSRELTEKGWKSFSDLYGRKPQTVVDVT